LLHPVVNQNSIRRGKVVTEEDIWDYGGEKGGYRKIA
jgi:hypothetical protein